jgi:hypothetical protein
VGTELLSALLQDWTTLEGDPFYTFVQVRDRWLDLARYGDVVFYLEVRGVAGNNVTLTYETAPSMDDSLFVGLATVQLAASTTPVITKIGLGSNPAVPLARYVRWRLTGTDASRWSATFRIWVSTMMGSASADPSALPLTGWWRGSYGGSPWTGNPSNGSSGSTNLSEATNPPAVGSAVNGFTPADFDGVTHKLATGGNVSALVSNSAGSIAALAYIDTAFTDTGSTTYFQAPAFVGDSASQGTCALCFTTSGVRLGSFNGSTWDSVAAAASTGAWHLLQGRWNSTTLEVRVDSGAWNTLARTVSMGNFAMVCGQSYNGANILDGKVLELLTAQSRFDDGTFGSLVAYVNGRYGLSL